MSETLLTAPRSRWEDDVTLLEAEAEWCFTFARDDIEPSARNDEDRAYANEQYEKSYALRRAAQLLRAILCMSPADKSNLSAIPAPLNREEIEAQAARLAAQVDSRLSKVKP